jgi:hypothetical protein
LRDSALLPSSIPHEPYLLNTPLLLNTTLPGSPNPTLVAPEFALPASLGITQTEQLTGPLGQVIIPGFSPVGVDPYHFPQSRTDSTGQVGTTVSYLTENQTTDLGFDYYHLHLDQYTDRNARPVAVFGGVGACCESLDNSGLFDPLSMAAAGAPTALYQTLATQPEGGLALRRLEFSWFVHRLQRVKALGPRVSLNYGIRFDIAALPISAESSRVLSSYNPMNLAGDFASAVAQCEALPAPIYTPGTGSGEGTLTPSQACQRTATALQSVLSIPLASLLDVNHPEIDLRSGLAWDMFGNGGTVLRAGVGSYHGQFPAAIIDESRSTIPDYLPLNLGNFPYINSSGIPVLYNVAGGFVPGSFGAVVQPGTLNQLNNSAENVVSLLAADLAAAGPILVPTSAGSNLRSPYAIHASLGVERQIARGLLLTAAYVGTLGRELLRVATPDRGTGREEVFFANVVPTFTASPNAETLPSAFPSFLGSMDCCTSARYARTLFESSGSSSYHSLQSELRGSLSRLQFGSSFTWSHAIDNASDFWDLSGAPALPANIIAPSERGSSNFDCRLRATGYFVLDLPKRGTALLSGWRLSGILSRQSGQPYTVNTVFDINGDGNLTDRPVIAPSMVQSGNRLLVAPDVSLAAAMGLVNGIQTGSEIGRNTFRLPSWNSVDLAAMKPIPLPHGTLLTPRIEMFNAFNSVEFAVPDRWLGSPALGLSGRSLLAPRTLQLVIRFDF